MTEGLEGMVVADSAITRIDGLRGELEYRGYNAVELARRKHFEEVAYLLWHAELPDPRQLAALDDDLNRARPLAAAAIEIMRTLPAHSHPLEAIRVGVTAVGAHDQERGRFDYEALLRQARRLMAVMPLLVGAWEQIRRGRAPRAAIVGHVTAAALLHALEVSASEASLRAMDADLVIYADHEFNASTFAARVVAATEADMYSATTAALAALKGPKHGGANEDVADLFDEIGVPSRVDSVIGERINRYRRLTSEERRSHKERFPGFGHRVWKVDDPRAEVLRELSRKVCEEAGRPELMDIAEQVRTSVQRELKLVVNVDYYSAALYMALGIPRDLCTSIFAVARVVGWTAHIIEQLAHNRLIRPRANYIGPASRQLDDAPMPRHDLAESGREPALS